VYFTSFNENSIEYLYSRRLKYILSCKEHLIDINFIDINLELRKATISESEFVYEGQNLREKLFSDIGIIKNSDTLNDPISLP
jgi:hypothetical protein